MPKKTSYKAKSWARLSRRSKWLETFYIDHDRLPTFSEESMFPKSYDPPSSYRRIYDNARYRRIYDNARLARQGK